MKSLYQSGFLSLGQQETTMANPSKKRKRRDKKKIG